jgi:hypothetical protein
MQANQAWIMEKEKREQETETETKERKTERERKEIKASCQIVSNPTPSNQCL